MDLDVDVGKLPNHLKLCVMFSGSILSFNSPQRTEIQHAVRFDAVPILSEKIPPTRFTIIPQVSWSIGPNMLLIYCNTIIYLTPNLVQLRLLPPHVFEKLMILHCQILLPIKVFWKLYSILP